MRTLTTLAATISVLIVVLVGGAITHSQGTQLFIDNGTWRVVIGYRGPDGAARGWNAGKGIGVGARSIAIKMA